MAREKDRKKFVELAENRVSRAIKDIKLIGNLSNKSNYSYTGEDVRKIHSALKKALDDMNVPVDPNLVNVGPSQVNSSGGSPEEKSFKDMTPEEFDTWEEEHGDAKI